jgi:hypothetical protein
MKYITTQQQDDKEELFTFPKTIDHDAMAEILRHIKNRTHGQWERVYRKPISAGFVDQNWVCFGRSESLGLDSRPEDTELLKSQMSTS